MPSNPKNSVPPPKRPAASWGFGNDSGKLGHKQDDDGYDSSRENDKNKTTFKERKKSKGRTSSLDDLKNVGKGDKSNKTYRTNLDNYRAIKLGLFKNGDPWFEPVNFHFLPGKEITSLEKLFHTISPKMDLIHGVTHMFDAKGKKITSLEEIEDGGIYVCSSSKKFSPGNYGSYGDGFYSGVAQTTTTNGGKRSVSPPQLPFSRSNSVMKKEKKQSTSVPLSAASSDISWLNDSKKAVILNGGGVKSGGVPNSPDGKVIRVINADNQTIQEKVLLNLKTSQSFEEVLVDLGQVLKIRRARLMCTKDGTEVKGFNQLRGVHAKETTFLISAFRNKVTYEGDDLDDSFATTSSYSPREARRNSDPVVQSRTRVSKSSARIESRAQSDKGRTQPDPLDTEGGTEPIKVTIKSERKLFYPPSKGYKKIVARPKSKPILDWVYGCRGFDVNRNVWILKSGELVYFVSTIAVIYAPVKESQRYYRGHNEDILCMDARPEQDLVMSAQRSGKTQDSRAHIRLWNADSLETLIVIGLGEYESKIAAVALSSNESSPGEILIAAVDGGGDRNLSVWQWDEKTRRAPLLGKVTTKADEIRGLAFHPLDNHLVITYGKNHLAFWTRTKNGYFDKSDMAQNKRTVTCLDFLDSGDLVVGDDSGSIKSYSVSAEGEYFKSNEFEAHPKGVNAVVALNDGIIASGGDKDRKIIAWDSARSFGKRGEAKLPDGVGSVRSISKHAVNQKPGDSSVYFCTTRNCILEGVIFKKTFKLNVWGHSSKLEAIAPHPNEQSFVTAGYDRYVVKWKNRKVAWKVTTQSELISVAYHPSGSTIVAGSLDGNVIVLNGETGAHVTTVRVCTVPLNELKFSFSGDYLACAAHKGDVHIFSSSKDGSSYKKEFKVGISNAPLITMDWSRDTRYIAAVTADFNLIFGDLKTQKVEKNAEALKDQEWIDQTCTMGFNVAGTWNNVGYKNDPSSTTAISISNHRDLVAAGDAQGFLRLFKYPCTTTRAEFNDAKTASNAVVGLRFLHQDKYLISVGGSDSTLLQWKIA